MTTAAIKSPKSLTKEQQAEEQGIELQDGETLERYRDLIAMKNALTALSARHLPRKEARIHFARCLRWVKPYVDEHSDERSRIQADHTPETGNDGLSEGDKVQFRDALGMARELAELDAMVVAVKLPSRITDAMLPVNDKAHPNNEDGIAFLIADLGALYEIDMEDGEEDGE